MSVTRSGSRVFVDLCIKYPWLALIVVPFAGWIFYDSLGSAKLYEGTREHKPQTMQVQKVYNAAGGLPPDYRAAGRAADGNIEVNLSKHHFEKLKPGNTLEYVATGNSKKPYVTTEIAKLQTGFIRFRAGGLPFNDGMIFASVFGVAAVAWSIGGNFVRQKDSAPESK